MGLVCNVRLLYVEGLGVLIICCSVMLWGFDCWCYGGSMGFDSFVLGLVLGIVSCWLDTCWL